MIRFHRFLFFLVILFCTTQVQAQLPVSVENLSDAQLMQLIAQYQLSGLTESELEAKAREKGLSTDQILVLKKRLALLDPTAVGQTSFNNKTDTYTERNRIYTRSPSAKRKDSLNKGELELFGADIFDNEDLSFEPNISIATPENYVLGVNDQLVIDVYGISDMTKKLKITTEGDIRFPNLGPIRVAGLTIETARIKIKNALTKIYPGIAKGTTDVQVSVGQIRSIHVTLLGQVKRAGTYTVSALATLMNALYASGGPNTIGSFRTIELVRGGKPIVTFDLYEFLLKGDLSKNLLLKDEDVIRVSPYKKRVAFKGAVKIPAIFDVKDDENAADILKYAGGFADIGYKEVLRVNRFGQNNKEVLSVRGDQLSQFKLVSGDTLYVDTLANIFMNRAMITGSVYYPGSYGIKEMPSLKELVTAAKPKEEAYYERAVIRRYKPDYTPSFIPFNVNDVLAGKFNLALQREDSVHIYKLTELKEKYSVIINGEINKPGTYDFYENMTVQDLVLMANGYRDGAALQKIEISRRLRQSAGGKDTSLYSIIKEIDLGKQNAGKSGELDFTLTPFDIISVRRSPEYKEQISVSVEGEVLYPGRYTLAGNRERISDIVKRAGGLKMNAFTAGAVLVRNTYLSVSQSDVSVVNSKANLINSQSRKGPAVSNPNDSTILKTLSDQQKPVGIKLEEALNNPGSTYDLYLEEGDVLKIPKTIQTIQTFGAVNVPKQIVFREGLTLKDAVYESGGFSINASRRNAYVVYANGEVKNTKKFLFFRSYPLIKAGAEVYVPVKRESRRLSTGEAIGLFSGLASVLGLIVVIINTSK